MYYRQIEYGIQKQTGCFPDLIIESLSVFDVLKYCDVNDYEGLIEYLCKGIQNLIQGGADFVCFTGITPHVVFDQVQTKISIPIISMMDAACEEIQRQGYRKIGLLGTYPTMKQDFFKTPLIHNGIDVITPSEDEMIYIGNKIKKELEFGIVNQNTQRKLCEIINRMKKENHIEAVILGCTELPLILNNEILTIPCLDVMNIHIRKLISVIIDD